MIKIIFFNKFFCFNCNNFFGVDLSRFYGRSEGTCPPVDSRLYELSHTSARVSASQRSVVARALNFRLDEVERALARACSSL